MDNYRCRRTLLSTMRLPSIKFMDSSVFHSGPSTHCSMIAPAVPCATLYKHPYGRHGSLVFILILLICTSRLCTEHSNVLLHQTTYVPTTACVKPSEYVSYQIQR